MYYLYLTSFVYINIFIVLHTDETMDELCAIELELYALYNDNCIYNFIILLLYKLFFLIFNNLPKMAL